MNIVMFVTILSGLAMFLYGMKIMGEGLEKVAGDKLQTIIKSLTSNMFKGVLVGTAVTAVIQSSSSTTVIVVGFVNAGIMTLPQAAAVIMGANIGTTVTAQIIRLGDADVATALQFFKPDFIAPLAIVAGVILIMICKKQRQHDVGVIVLGFGLLFTGMETMSNGLSTFKDSPVFIKLFEECKNPLTGVLAGTVVTGVIQSSSASIGILQAVSDSGAVTYAAAIPIIMGQNIGTCVTAILACIGANTNAKKAAMLHLYFNVIGSIVMLLLYVMPFTAGFRAWAEAVVINRGGIADVHLLFNIVNTVMLLPCTKFLIWLANITVGEKKNVMQGEPTGLDKRFLNTPSIAIAQCEEQIRRMYELVMENVQYARRSIIQGDLKCIANLDENENVIDNYEVDINNFLTLITDKDITEHESKTVSSIFHTVMDLERISDHTKNISETAKENASHKKQISEKGLRELDLMFAAVTDVITQTYEAYTKNDIEEACRLKPYEEVIDMFNHTLRTKHIERLKKQKCSVRAGINFLDVVTNLERIGDHCNNIALSVIRRNSDDDTFNTHRFSKNMEVYPDREYNKYFSEFEEKYYKPLIEKKETEETPESGKETEPA